MRADLPIGIEPAHMRPRAQVPVGAGALVILSAMITAALVGWLGGTPSSARKITTPSAVLSVEQPDVVRSGMVFETRIELTARKRLEDATIAMSPSLWRSITINTAMPQASEEEFSQGRFRMHFGSLEPGETLFLKLDSQINPDLYGGTRGEISAHDGDRTLAILPVKLKVLP